MPITTDQIDDELSRIETKIDDGLAAAAQRDQALDQKASDIAATSAELAEATGNAISNLNKSLSDLNTKVNNLPTSVPATPTAPPVTAGNYGAVEIASFSGSDWDAKLDAAIAHVKAQTLPPTLLLPVGRTDVTFTRPRSVFPGLAVRGAYGANEQPRGGNPYPVLIKIRMAAQSDKNKPLSWWNWDTGGNLFSTYFGHFAAEGSSTSQMFRTSPSSVSWRSVFDTLGTSGFRHIWGRPGEKFLNTAADLAIGPHNHNNVLGTAGTFGGSDSMFGDGARILIDCPPTFGGINRRDIDGTGRPQPFLVFDYQEKITIQGLFITAREATALVINGNSNTDGVRVRDCELEGRNSGDPSFGSVVRVNGGFADITSCWMSYGGAALTRGSFSGDAAAAVTVAGGDVILDKPLYGKADAVAADFPAYAVTGGKLTIRLARAVGGATAPVARKIGGQLDADNSVRVVNG